MPANLSGCVLAEGMSLDQITHRVTAFNMLDVIRSKSVPALFPKLMVLVAYDLDGTPETFFERVTLVAPSGATVATSATQLTVQGLVHNSIHALWALRLEEFGHYKVVVARAERRDGEWKTLVERRLSLVNEAHPQWVGGTQPRTPGGTSGITE